MKKERLLFIVNVDWFFVSHRLPLAIAALEQGKEVHLACQFTSLRDELEVLGIITHELPLTRSGVALLGEAKAMFSIYSTIKNIDPDVVHLVTIKPVIYGGLAARLLDINNVIASISGLGFVFIDNSFKARVIRGAAKLFYRIGLNRCGVKVIFQNETDKGLFIKHKIIKDKQGVLIKGSGVNLQSFSYREETDGQKVVMFLARLLKDKGLMEFLEASKLLKISHPNVRFVLVGDIDPENPNSISAEQLASWVSSEVVEHWGYSTDVAETITKSHIMVLPSYREGLPKSLIEAGACGRAIVTTDVPGCRDAIVPNRTGLLVKPRDIAGLVSAITTLLVDDSLRRELGREGRINAEKQFGIEEVVDRHLELYFGAKQL